MGHLGVLVFSSPLQRRSSTMAAGTIEAAVRGGHSVSAFFLADGVYCTSRAHLAAPEETVVHRLARMPSSVALVNCSTCARFRGLDDAAILSNARNGSLEDLVDFLGGTDRFLTFGSGP